MKGTSSSTAVERGTASVNHVRAPGSDAPTSFAHRRRQAVSCLRNHESSITLADLADEVAVRENGTPLTEIAPEEVKHVYMSLYHSHVPKLEDANVVEYIQSEDLIELSAGVRGSFFRGGGVVHGLGLRG